MTVPAPSPLSSQNIICKNIISAIKFEMSLQKALNTSKKVKLLLNDKDSGQEYDFKAKTYLNRRNRHLNHVKQWVTQKYGKFEKATTEKINSLLKKYDIGKIFEDQKRLLLIDMFNSDMSHEEFETSIKQLEEQQKEIEKLDSFEDLYKYFHQQMDRTIKKYGNPNLEVMRIYPIWPLCFIILVFNGLVFLACLLAAIGICAIAEGFGLECDAALLTLTCYNNIMNAVCYRKITN